MTHDTPTVRQQDPATGAWEPAQPLGWAPGLDVEGSRTEFGHHWALFWHSAELAHGTARTRLGLAVATARARRRWRVAGPAVGALLELRRTARATSDVETRLLGRRCRCSRPATMEIRGCLWHSSVTAEYARHLERVVADLVQVPLPGDPPAQQPPRFHALVILVAAMRRINRRVRRT